MSTTREQIQNGNDYLRENANGTYTVTGTGTHLDGVVINPDTDSLIAQDGAVLGNASDYFHDNEDGTYTVVNTETEFDGVMVGSKE